MEQNYLNDIFITEFDENFKVLRNIKSNKIDISSKQWQIQNAKIYEENDYSSRELMFLKTNFDFKRIQTLYSDFNRGVTKEKDEFATKGDLDYGCFIRDWRCAGKNLFQKRGKTHPLLQKGARIGKNKIRM